MELAAMMVPSPCGVVDEERVFLRHFVGMLRCELPLTHFLEEEAEATNWLNKHVEDMGLVSWLLQSFTDTTWYRPGGC